MIAWNILKEDFNKISDIKTMRRVNKKEVDSCYNREEENSDNSELLASSKSNVTGLGISLHGNAQSVALLM